MERINFPDVFELILFLYKGNTRYTVYNKDHRYNERNVTYTHLKPSDKEEDSIIFDVNSFCFCIFDSSFYGPNCFYPFFYLLFAIQINVPVLCK